MSRFLLITFNFYARPAPTDKIKACFEKAEDWVTWAPNCWLIRTQEGTVHWFNELKKILDKDDTFLVIEVNVTARMGFLPTKVIDWLGKYDGSKPKT